MLRITAAARCRDSRRAGTSALRDASSCAFGARRFCVFGKHAYRTSRLVGMSSRHDIQQQATIYLLKSSSAGSSKQSCYAQSVRAARILDINIVRQKKIQRRQRRQSQNVVQCLRFRLACALLVSGRHSREYRRAIPEVGRYCHDDHGRPARRAASPRPRRLQARRRHAAAATSVRQRPRRGAMLLLAISKSLSTSPRSRLLRARQMRRASPRMQHIFLAGRGLAYLLPTTLLFPSFAHYEWAVASCLKCATSYAKTRLDAGASAKVSRHFTLRCTAVCLYAGSYVKDGELRYFCRFSVLAFNMIEKEGSIFCQHAGARAMTY